MSISIVTPLDATFDAQQDVEFELLSELTTDNPNAHLTYQWSKYLISDGGPYVDIDGETSNSITTKIHDPTFFKLTTKEIDNNTLVELEILEQECDVEILCLECEHSCEGKPGCWCENCLGNCYEKWWDEEESEIEPYHPDGFVDHSGKQGIEYDLNFATNGTPGSPALAEGFRVNIKNIVQQVKNDMELLSEEIAANSHLSPQTKNENDLKNLFSGYGLDITKALDHQELNNRKQFEGKNFSSYIMSKFLTNILEPVDRVLCCLQMNINSIRGMTSAFTRQKLTKNTLITIVDYYLDANGVYAPVIEPASSLSLLPVHGFVAHDTDEYTCVPIFFYGIMHFDEIIDFYPGDKVFLSHSSDGEYSFGCLSSDESDPNNFPCLYQRIGTVMKGNRIWVQPMEPIIRYYTDQSAGGGLVAVKRPVCIYVTGLEELSGDDIVANIPEGGGG